MDSDWVASSPTQFNLAQNKERMGLPQGAPTSNVGESSWNQGPSRDGPTVEWTIALAFNTPDTAASSYERTPSSPFGPGFSNPAVSPSEKLYTGQPTCINSFNTVSPDDSKGLLDHFQFQNTRDYAAKQPVEGATIGAAAGRPEWVAAPQQPDLYAGMRIGYLNVPSPSSVGCSVSSPSIQASSGRFAQSLPSLGYYSPHSTHPNSDQNIGNVPPKLEEMEPLPSEQLVSPHCHLPVDYQFPGADPVNFSQVGPDRSFEEGSYPGNWQSQNVGGFRRIDESEHENSFVTSSPAFGDDIPVSLPYVVSQTRTEGTSQKVKDAAEKKRKREQKHDLHYYGRIRALSLLYAEARQKPVDMYELLARSNLSTVNDTDRIPVIIPPSNQHESRRACRWPVDVPITFLNSWVVTLKVNTPGGMDFSLDSQERNNFLEPSVIKSHNSIPARWPVHAQQSTYQSFTLEKPELESKTTAHVGFGQNYPISPNPLIDPRSPSIRDTFLVNLPSTWKLMAVAVNTNFGAQYRERASPSAPSPASANFYAGHQYGGSTPSLVSPSLSSPPTGKSALLTLTPEQGMHSVHQIHGTPEQWDGASLLSPGIYGAETGTTPDLTGLNIYEDLGFGLAPSFKGTAGQSVLLGSNTGSENPQDTNLDPLEFGDALADIGHLPGPAPAAAPVTELVEDGPYNIRIVPDPNSEIQGIPVTVDNQSMWPPGLLSPLSALHSLPIERGAGGGHNLNDHFSGVAFQPSTWDGHFDFPSTNTPSSAVTPLNENRTPPQLSPRINSDLVPNHGATYRTVNPQSTHFPNFGKDVSRSPGSQGEAAPSGQPQIVNRKGVSERTLAAAEANRKREAKFHCHICGNSQTSKQNLDNHIASRHMQLKRFPCPVEGCSAKYGHARGVNRHLDAKHPGHRQAASKTKRGPKPV
ncbi:hypothetical protein AN958_10547 [Leucoagaricus sp. SymC.cos]|nr:hypothetical protein AN958_10547 [Leucoagaricus sp. SymC.cos]